MKMKVANMRAISGLVIVVAIFLGSGTGFANPPPVDSSTTAPKSSVGSPGNSDTSKPGLFNGWGSQFPCEDKYRDKFLEEIGKICSDPNHEFHLLPELDGDRQRQLDYLACLFCRICIGTRVARGDNLCVQTQAARSCRFIARNNIWLKLLMCPKPEK